MMASELMKANIPGASLEGQTLEALKIEELTFWLCYHGAIACKLSKLKMKSDYLQRFVLSDSLTICTFMPRFMLAICVAHTSIILL